MAAQIEQIVQDFFKVIEAKPTTSEVYGHALNHYSNFHKMAMEELLEEAEEDIVNKVIPRKQRIVKRMIDFNDYLAGKYSANSKGLYMGAVRSFYKSYGINIPRIGNSKRKNLIKIENQWQGFDRQEVARQLKECSLRNRAMILLICSSGMGKKEMRNLKRDDFEGKQDRDNVTTFKLRRSKTQFDYYTFCTPETTQAIKDYLKTRKDNNPYLFVSRNGDKITVPGWTWIYKNLNGKVGFDREEQQYSQTRSHNYRKFFQSTLQNGGAPVWFVDFCMAHNTDEVRAHYHLADPEKLKEIYKNFMHLLAIEDRSFELLKDDEMKRIMAENQEMKKQLELIMSALKAKGTI